MRFMSQLKIWTLNGYLVCTDVKELLLNFRCDNAITVKIFVF